MSMVLRSLILTLVLIAGMEGTAVAQQAARALAAQRIVAVVNDDVVSLRDLEERLQLILVTSGVPDTPEARERLAPQVLRGLIEETLQLQEAERLDVQVTPGEIDQALNSIAGRNNMTVDEMRAAVTHARRATWPRSRGDGMGSRSSRPDWASPTRSSRRGSPRCGPSA